MKRGLKRVFVVLMVFTMVFGLLTPSAYALTGSWVRTDDGKQYVLEDGSCYKNTMKQIGGKWYYFDEEGYMVTATTITYKNKVYYFGKTGVRATGWITLSDGKHYFSKTGAMAIGNLQINGDEYYFDSDGVMQTNFWKDGKYYGEDGKYVPDATDDTTENLEHWLKVVDGVVTDVITGNTYPDMSVESDYFYGDGKTKISLSGNWNETIEAVVDYDNDKLKNGYPVLYTYDNTNGANYPNSVLTLTYSNGSFGVQMNRCAVNPYSSHYVTANSNYLRDDGLYVYETMPEGDVFVAISGDVSNYTGHVQVNGAAATYTMDNSLQWYYRDSYRSFTVLANHKVKELRFYNGARTAEQLADDYEKSGVGKEVVEKVTGTDGVAGLGSPLAWYFDADGNVVRDDLSSKKAGTYTITTKDGEKTIGIAAFNPEPDYTVDNSIYESLHIINKRETMLTGKQYPISAYPYPLQVSSDGTSDFDIVWKSSNTSVVDCIDGLLIAKKAGSATITATLRGTKISDSFKVTVKNPETVEDKVYNVPSDFVSSEGYSFSDTDYEMTMKAIFAAIDYAKDNGYNHVVFPKQKFYASVYQSGVHYYVPSNMTIEFPEGSELHMMYRSDMIDPTKYEFHVFEFGVPSSDYTNRCENSHLIIADYFGERYEEYQNSGSVTEDKYIEEMRFAEFGRKAYNCSVEVKNAQYPAGYFITADGTSADPNKTDGVIKYSDMVSGKLDANGNVVSDSNWISTNNFITVPEKIKTDGFFISADGQDSYAGKYWNGCSARLYNIIWYDADKNIIGTNEWYGISERYDIPAEAAYYKISLQQSALPSPSSSETTDRPWLAMHDNGAAVDCEIKNTNAYHTATGLFSVVGETDGLWIHDNYVPQNGEKPNDERTGDFENGCQQMRHSVVNNNVFLGSAYASGGHNNFVHTNYFYDEVYTRPDDEQGHLINNRALNYICSEKFVLNFYYNSQRSVLWNLDKLSGWKCLGHLHKYCNKSI